MLSHARTTHNGADVLPSVEQRPSFVKRIHTGTALPEKESKRRKTDRSPEQVADYQGQLRAYTKTVAIRHDGAYGTFSLVKPHPLRKRPSVKRSKQIR